MTESIKRSVNVVIPVYKPDDKFGQLLEMLNRQTHKPDRIIIINTEKKFFDESRYTLDKNTEIHHITIEEFDHGATRNYGFSLADSDYVLFMTMDAVPADIHLIETMLRIHESENAAKAAVVYARQLPDKECSVIEQYTRSFNYPDKDMIKTASDIRTMGIKAFFCSDVCAMYNADIFRQLGGFINKAIFNEDMIYAAKALKKGYSVCYCAKARVIHSHNYSIKQQFSRNFDMGVSQADHPEVFEGIKSESEGVKLVMATAKHLFKIGKWYLVPYMAVSSAAKLAGYRLGRKYRSLSPKKVLKYTTNRNYWNK